MTDVKFVLREPKSEVSTPITLLFRFSGQRLKYSINEKILPKRWNVDKQRAKVTREFPENSELNTRLDNLASTVKLVYRRLVNDGFTVTPKSLKEAVDLHLNPKTETPVSEDVKNEVQITYYEFVENYLEEVKNKFQASTIQVYRSTVKHLKEFEAAKKYKIDFLSINMKFYNSFVNYLIEKNIFNNTIGKYIKTIKSIQKKAEKEKIPVHPDYKDSDFKVLEEQADTIYLTEKEIEQLYKYDFSHDYMMDAVRDLFIIGAYTGLRYSDFTRLRKEHFIYNEEKNKHFIIIRTKKTKQEVSIPAKSTVLAIMDKYQYEIPQGISNDLMNAVLKDIGKAIGLNQTQIKTRYKGAETIVETYSKFEQLTTHTCRRSFCTNGFLAGIEPKKLMIISGHKTEKAFLKYIKVNSLDNAINIADDPYFN